MLAVGRVARLHVPRHAGSERARFAAVDRQLVDVAQQIERDALAVRADVDAHPRAGAHVERNLAALARRRGHVPFVLLLSSAAVAAGLSRKMESSRAVACGPLCPLSENRRGEG